MTTEIKGIWYEERRRRYRVRIYSRGKLFHQSFHRSFEEAKRVHRQKRREARRRDLGQRMEFVPVERLIEVVCVQSD